MREIVIWAHSECGSNMALYREVKRQSAVPVTIALWKYGGNDDVRLKRESEGQEQGAYADLGCVHIGDDYEAGMALIASHGGAGAVHVFCVYQNSEVWRRLIIEAKARGARVIVSAEAPCEMCLGVKAWLKRLYYRFILPGKVGNVARRADLFLNASGSSGIGRLVRLGWAKEKIVPFGYASEVNNRFRVKISEFSVGSPLRVLHTGVEAPYRGVFTLLRAVKLLKVRGVQVELVRTYGTVSKSEMDRLYGWADVVVSCGFCEPWGIRVNDAIHAGLPVAVSSGMGVRMLVDETGCGCVFKRGNARELADILERMAKDDAFMARLQSGAAAAHEAWKPVARAAVWLKAVCG